MKRREALIHMATLTGGLTLLPAWVRMGTDAGTSLLNKWNQLYSCKKVFITDGPA
jgi:hypothetical protein